MSHFYGMITQSSRQTATARATKKTGLTVEAASWSGKVVIDLSHDDETEEDRFAVYQSQHHGAGIGERIATGVIGETTTNGKDERIAKLTEVLTGLAKRIDSNSGAGIMTESEHSDLLDFLGLELDCKTPK